MCEIREVLRLWVLGEGLRSVERLAGVDRKTVRRYVDAAVECGLIRDGGVEELMAHVIDVFLRSILLELLEVRQDCVCESRYIDAVVRSADNPIAVEEVGDAQREVGVLFIGRPYHLVIPANFSLEVGQQAIAETVGVAEGLVFCRSVEGSTEDDAISRSEITGPVTQALALDRSALGRCLRVPPEENPMAELVVQGHDVSVLVRQGEPWGFGAGLEHANGP